MMDPTPRPARMAGLLAINDRTPPILQKVPVPVRQAPVIPIRPQPLGERLREGLFTAVGGGYDGNLTLEQNQKARQQAMLMAGLQVLQANDQGSSPMAAIAQGLVTGRQTGDVERQNIYLSTQEERLRQALQNPAVVGKLTPEQLAMIQLMPPMEAVKTLSEIAFRPAAVVDPKVVGKSLVGPNGEVIYREPDDPENPFKDLPSEIKAALFAAGITDPEQLTPEQRANVYAEAEKYRRAGTPSTTVNVNSERRADFADTNALGTQFRQDISDFQIVADNYAAIETAAQDPSPAGDIAIVFGYMKMLDPTSVVREGEQATAQNAGSVPERVRAAYNRAINGQRFTPAQRADFVNQARQRAEQRRRQMAPVLNRYKSRAEAGGVDPNMIVYDPFAEIGLSGGGSSPSDPFGDL